MNFNIARENMVKNQVMPSDVTNKRLLNAMFEIPREKFVPPENILHAYNEIAIPVGCEREIIETRFLGKMINAFDPNPNELILDVGCAMGYSTAILAKMSQAVVMLENSELSEGREKIFTELGLDNVIVARNSVAEGVKEHAPYEGIFVQLAIDYFPEEFKDQLKVGGKALVVFNREGVKQCFSGLKTEVGMSWTYQFDANVAYLSELKADKGFEF